MQCVLCVSLLLVAVASAGRIIEARTKAAADVTTTTPISPPPKDDLPRVARYLVHQLDWGMLATLSAREPTYGDPFAHSISIADGLPGSGAGVPYFYQSEMAMATVDLMSNPRMSLGITLAMTDYCRLNNFDQQSPLCVKIMLNGEWTTILKDSEEWEMAKEFLFARHPEMKDWPADHGFFFSKLEIDSIRILNWFGGSQDIPVADYLAANDFPEYMAKNYNV